MNVIFQKLIVRGKHLIIYGGTRGVMAIVVGNELDDMSSNPGRDWLHFT